MSANDIISLFTAGFTAGAVVASLVMAIRVVIGIFRRCIGERDGEERSSEDC